MRQLFLLFLAFSQAAVAQRGGRLVIPVGNAGRIVYDLKRGEYDVDLGGVGSLHAVRAACRIGDSVYDSRRYGGYGYEQTVTDTRFGKAKLYTITHGPLVQRFYVFPGKSYFLTNVALALDSCGWMAPVVSDRVVMRQRGELRALCVPFDNDMWARYKSVKLADARFTSSEVAAVYDEQELGGLVMGSLEQDVWKTGVLVKGGADSLGVTIYGGLSDSVITHDHLAHGMVRAVKGVCSSPLVMVGCFGDWRDGMEVYARLDSLAQPRSIFSWDKAVPMAWNSWGAIQDKLSFDKARAVVDYLSNSLKGFRDAQGSLYIDLDAFWDNMTPGGIGGDLSKLVEFVAYCKARGFKPGIYWTPFADWGKWDRVIEGSHFGYASTWTTQHGKPMDVDGGRAMDPTHPGTRERIVYVLGKLKGLGFEMIKIDFLGHGALEADHFYDPGVTTGMQAFASGMALVDSVLGNQMLVYAAISPNVATARYVHVRRIGCDAFSAIDNTEYTLNSAGYGWWQHGIYDFPDGDHVVFNQLPDAENRARLVSSMVTGTLVTGDNYGEAGKWRATAQRLLQDAGLLGVVAGRTRFRPVFAGTGDRGVEVFAGVSSLGRYLALVNYGDVEKRYTVPLERAGLGGVARFEELFSGSAITADGKQVIVRVAAHDGVVLKAD